MVSLELEARLDNLLATAQEEMTNIDIFSPIPEREECPICMIPLPLREDETILMKCCGKNICCGCICKNLVTEQKKGKLKDYKCAFCCQPNPKTIKALKKLMKKNNPQAFYQMATQYEEGDGVIQSNTKSLEMYICAAELGHAQAFGAIGESYEEGIAVEQDMSKALEFWKIAAKKGSWIAHDWLACFHLKNGSENECIEHMKVAASAGDQESMDDLMKVYKENRISKEDLTQTLRAYQASIDDMKSKDRDAARLFEEARKKGEAPPAHLITEGW